MRTRRLVHCLVILTPWLVGGCFERGLRPVDPCTSSEQGELIESQEIDEVDLLLMIDNSNSMTEEQASVVTEVPRIVGILTSGDRDGDGVQDFTPARSLHIGIVDSDMGLGDVTGIATCDPGFGDDGLMQIRARHPGAGCMADYRGSYPGNVFDFTVGGSTTSMQFASDVACVATLGTDGCGFEFELESPLKALSLVPTATGDSPVSWTRAGYRPPTFYAGTFGHGGDPATNGAFLRPDSALAIVTINDEDDCSTPNPHIFSLDDPSYADAPLNLRCHTFGSELYPVQRYADGFVGLRANPAMLIYATITGVPLALAGMDPAVILASPDMQERIDASGDALVPSCVSPLGRGVAYPGRRMTELAQLLSAAGASTTVQSICNTDFSAAFDTIIDLISQAIDGVCLARQLNPDGEGFVDCDVLEVLPAIGSGASYEHCADLEHPEAYTLDHVEVTSTTGGALVSREVCRVRQVGRSGAGLDTGWAYDDGDQVLLDRHWSRLPAGCTQRVGLSVISPVTGAEIRLQCNQTILPATSAAARLGSPCDPATGMTTASPAATCSVGHAVAGNPATLACDAFDRSCQIPCTSDADCTGAGLLAYVCDQRTAEQYFTGVPTGIAPTARRAFCVNPTCGR